MGVVVTALPKAETFERAEVGSGFRLSQSRLCVGGIRILGVVSISNRSPVIGKTIVAKAEQASA